MSLTASRANLIHRARIERDANGGDVNEVGAVDAPDWQPFDTLTRCRFWVNTGREVLDATASAVDEDMRMIVPLDTDVTEQDRIAAVYYRSDTIAAGPIGIRAVVRRRDHLELFLVRIG
jgi:hypothetical protein